MENKIVTDKWKVCILGDVCELIRGVSFKPSDVVYKEKSGYIPILRAGNIGNRLDLDNDLIWIPKHLVSNQQILRPNDIAICMSSGSPLVVGKNAILDQEWRGSVGAFCGIIRGNNANISQYLSYWLRSSTYLEWRNTQARGANINNLRFSEFSKLSFPLPPLPEQQRIAAILKEQLAAVEQARKASEARLEAAQALSAAYMREIFESEEAKEWQEVTIGSVAFEVQNGIYKDARFYGTGNPFLRMYNLDNSSWQINQRNLAKVQVNPNELNKFKLVEGDLLISRVNSHELVGKCGWVGSELEGHVFENMLIRLRFSNDIDSKFVAQQMCMKSFKDQIQSRAKRAIGQSSINSSDIRQFKILLPSLRKQCALSRMLDAHIRDASVLSSSINQEFDYISILPKSLLRQAFDGII